MHGSFGVLLVHSFMPVSKSRLNAVHCSGSGTRNHSPEDVVSKRIGAIENMHSGLSLQS